MLAEDSGQLLPNNAGKTRSKFIILVAKPNKPLNNKQLSHITIVYCEQIHHHQQQQQPKKKS
jgi:hypothetical protein